MTPFLTSVARAYASRYRDLSDFCFVFPNKRAGTFFLKALASCSKDRPILAPSVTTIAKLAGNLSGRIVDNQIDLLFFLYKSYIKILAENALEEGVDIKEIPTVEFDDFRMWGETVLKDFGEIDMYLVNPDEIFKNLKDLREISADYLTDEQREVMEEYFGYQPGQEKSSIESFWKTFESDSKTKDSFLFLWQTMAPLYHALEGELEKRGLVSPSGAYRLALDNLREEKVILPWKKMVFVGFNALSLVERELFKELGKMDRFEGPEGPEPFADYLWDGTGPLLNSDSSKHGPARFINLNRRDFPQPEWAEPFIAESEVNTLPESITVLSSPSNAYQAKIVGKEIERLMSEVPKEEFEDAKVAVVLPDENLLLPLLYSLPEQIQNVNLTMGYPLKLTSTASFVSLYRLLHKHAKTDQQSEPGFYHRDLRRFIAHPFVHAVAGSAQIARLNRWLNESHRMAPTLKEIKAHAPEVADLLSPLPPNATPAQTASNLADTLNRIKKELSDNKSHGIIKSRLDIDHINRYLDNLVTLLSAVEEHSISMSTQTFFNLADRLLATQTVRFEGEPLVGLQVMGMLETRALDFDRVIIPSANERKLPVKGRTNTFIPNSLRAGYHIPPMQHQESLAAYYFYRLISRAKEVVICYDSRTGGGFGSEPSRYIMQLKHIMAPGKVQFKDFSFSLAGKGSPIDSIPKSPRTIKILERYLRKGSGFNLSASALKTYSECGIRFFYERIAGIKTDNEPSEFIDPITQGNVVHEVMTDLYLSPDKQHKFLEKPVLITKEQLLNLRNNGKYIDSLIRRSINRNHFNLKEEELTRKLPPTAELVARNLRWWILHILDRDAELAPLMIYGCEFGETVHYPLDEGREVNMRFIIDRLDSVGSGYETDHHQYRIVDYKTSQLKAADYAGLEPEEIFKKADPRGYAPQPLLYGELLNFWLQKNGRRPMDFDFVLYNVSKIYNKKKPDEGVIRFKDVERRPLADDPEVASKFRSGLHQVLTEIFDPEQPFEAARDQEKACRYCPLGNLCGR